MRFRGLTALVTGGGTGIGAAVARRLASEGANVAVMGRRREPLQALADETGCFVVQADAADSDAVRAALQEIHGKFGKVDILIANAGGHGVGPTISMTDETWSLATRLNLDTAFVCARESLPDLIAQKGAVVVVASIAGLFAGPAAAGYVTMKHACIGFGKSLARDYGRKGVRTNIVCPGWVATAMGSVSPSARTNTPRSKQVSAYPRAARSCPERPRSRPRRAERNLLPGQHDWTSSGRRTALCALRVHWQVKTGTSVRKFGLV
ncbi:SDR family NAD(P)-dependent oxidoreductase [Bradyrhizobium quebecense]|uniref:SDR family oxidoreductase n=2 Tax=Bradyrhizobium quebecense TaxID=2748629 RepID=A0ACD3V7P3_9BRAD|nr:SDR family oxidoreductase [Bradyrhizobium quebecense]UGY02177.1 SDR family oxidoreductase [Bradyrhizobium quebecense]